MTGLSDDMRDLASDYVLGLMPDGEARLFEEVIGRDPDLAWHVGALRDQLLPLDLSAAPRALPEGLLERVQARLDAAPAHGAPAPAVTKAPARPANVPRAPSGSMPSLLAASLVGVALGFGAGWMRPAPDPVPDPVVIAVLLDDQGVPQAVVEDYGNDTATVRFVAEIDVPADRSLQVWTLPSAELGATSLGVLDRAGPTRLSFEDLPGPTARQLYEVTLEPAGGSPTGRPTGPILGKGLASPQI